MERAPEFPAGGVHPIRARRALTDDPRRSSRRAESHPGRMRRDRTAARGIEVPLMNDYKEHLRRLAMHDDALLEGIQVEGSSSSASSVIDERTAALVRVAATVALDGAPASFQHVVAHALAAGATEGEIVAHPRGGDAGDGRCASRPLCTQGRARARLRRRGRPRGARPVNQLRIHAIGMTKTDRPYAHSPSGRIGRHDQT